MGFEKHRHGAVTLTMPVQATAALAVPTAMPVQTNIDMAAATLTMPVQATAALAVPTAMPVPTNINTAAATLTTPVTRATLPIMWTAAIPTKLLRAPAVPTILTTSSTTTQQTQVMLRTIQRVFHFSTRSYYSMLLC